MVKVYIGFDWNKKRRETNTYPYVFLSAGVVWSYSHNKKLVPFKFSEQTKEIFLDSGGFSFFTKYSEYPFSVKEYVEWIHEMQKINNGKVKYVATMDYPCEPSINRKAFSSNKERIEKTVENAIKCFKNEIPAKWIPVLQGYNLDEYVFCLNLYKKHGILTDYIAVGSMCKRSNISEIVKIVHEIKKNYKGKIHLFGLAIKALQNKALFDMIYSCDTIGYTFASKTVEETFEKMRKLVEKINKLVILNSRQRTLIDVTATSCDKEKGKSNFSFICVAKLFEIM